MPRTVASAWPNCRQPTNLAVVQPEENQRCEGSPVEKGQVIAQLSSWSQQSEVDVARAELKQARAELARLEASPTEEELALAESKVESARARTTYNEAQAKRAEELVSTGVVSQSEWEKAASDLETSMADLRVAEADLQLVRRGPTEPQIEAARAEVERLEHELASKLDELERTRIRAPTDGHVVTPNVHLLQGIWLRTGTELLRIEDTRTVEAMIDVPEGDVGLVSVSDTVRLKPWEDSDVEITGVVTEVSPTAEERDYGKVVRVRAPIDNERMRLRPGMTGYAKLEGSQMRVWEAYLRFLVRFVRVEVWSWVP